MGVNPYMRRERLDMRGLLDWVEGPILPEDVFDPYGAAMAHMLEDVPLVPLVPVYMDGQPLLFIDELIEDEPTVIMDPRDKFRVLARSSHWEEETWDLVA